MLSKFSVKKPYTVFVGVILIIVLGFVSFTRMTTDLLPSIDLPYAIVMTTYVGASPEQVEEVVTRPMEQSMATINNIKHISSMSSENVSTVILEFEDSVNMDSISIDIREQIDLISGYWSDEVGSPIIMKLNPDMLPVIVAAVDMEEMESDEITNYVESTVIPMLESVEGVASVSSQGLYEEQINVVLNPTKIEDMNEKISEALHGTLEEAQDELDSANEEITKGKEELEKQTTTFLEGIRTGESTLEEAKAEILKSEILVEVTSSQLEQNEATLKTLKQTVTRLETQLKTIENQLTSSDAKEAIEALKTLRKQTKDSIKEIDAQLVVLEGSKQEVEEAKREIEGNEELTVLEKEAALAAFDTSLIQIEEGIAALNTSKESLTAVVNALNTSIKEANNLTVINSLQKEINDLKKQISDSEKAIATGKTQLTAAKRKITQGQQEIKTQETNLQKQKDEAEGKLEEAKEQLTEGETTLNEQLENFEQMKEEVLSNADLNNILSSELLSNLLMAQNFSMPAGYITEGASEYLVRVGDKFDKIRDIRNMVLFDLGIDGIDPIVLGDVADVFTVNNASEMYAKVNGNDAIILSIQKQTNYATADVSEKVKERLGQLSEETEGFHATYLMDQGVYIELIVNSVINNLLYGGILAIFILFLFLRDIRPTFIIACSIPISVIFAIILMYFSGVTLNIISLSGLAVGVGMLVDNSVVVIENIYRLRSKGVGRVQAAVNGAIQVSGAIIASTLTTVCVFFPIVFVEGITRQLFVDMALTIGYSLGASLIIALTFVPMMSAGMLKNIKQKEHKLFNRVIRVYEIMLQQALRFKVIVLLIAISLLAGSGMWALSEGFEYMPEMDSTQISIEMTMPEGSELEDTVEMSNLIIERIETLEDVETVGAMLSSDGMMSSGGSTDSVTMYVLLKEEKLESSQNIAKEIVELCSDLPCGISANGSTMDMSALGGSGVTLLIKGYDLDTLRDTAIEIAEKVAKVEGIEEVDNGIDDPTTELRITVKKDVAMAEGLTVAGAYQQIATALSGEQQATTLALANGTELPVMLVRHESKDVGIDEIGEYEFTITTQAGETKTLTIQDIATVSMEEGFSTIRRDAQQRYVSVSATVEEGYNVSLVTSAVSEQLNEYELPEGFELVYEGENETIMESLEQLVYMLLLGVLLIYLIMVAQFQSLLSPFIVLFTIPLAFTGGFLALLATSNVVSVIAMIGFVMLAGIIVNNGIVLVDYMNQLRLDGMEKREAIIEAGKTRLRPILMTAVTTILGLSTMAIGMGMGADMVQPIAIVTIGGLSYATLMTLFVIPVLYDVFHRKEMRKVNEEELQLIEE